MKPELTLAVRVGLYHIPVVIFYAFGEWLFVRHGATTGA